MIRFLLSISTLSVALAVLGAPLIQSTPTLPPGHPTTSPQLPPGHPPANPGMPAGHPPIAPSQPSAPAPANPADVASIDAIVAAYYDSISGPAGQPRNWDRFQSLFIPGAHLFTLRGTDAQGVPVVLTPEEYAATNARYFERGGYFEQEIHRRLDKFTHVAHVFSTYASRRREADPQPYSRGINSIQLLNDGTRWWITSVSWDSEHPARNPIPSDYLPFKPPIEVQTP